MALRVVLQISLDGRCCCKLRDMVARNYFVSEMPAGEVEFLGQAFWGKGSWQMSKFSIIAHSNGSNQYYSGARGGKFMNSK